MKVALVLDYHDLERIAKLFTLLQEHYPGAWISFEMHGKLQPAIHPVLWLKEELTQEDKTFLDGLKAPFLTGSSPSPRHDVIRYWEIKPEGETQAESG